MNRIQLRGRVGNVRISMVAGRSVCRFSVATNTIYRNAENQPVEEVTWHNCFLWSSKRYPDISFIRVGRPVEVTGRIRSNKYTGSDGIERVATEVAVNEINILPENEPLTAATSI